MLRRTLARDHTHSNYTEQTQVQRDRKHEQNLVCRRLIHCQPQRMER